MLKATLKSCGIPHTTWEATATDRALWRSTCHSGLQDYEEKWCDALRDKRTRRKAIQPSTNIDTSVFHVCIVTTENMPTQTLTEVEIRRVDGSLHTSIHTLPTMLDTIIAFIYSIIINFFKMKSPTRYHESFKISYPIGNTPVTPETRCNCGGCTA